VAGSYVIHRRDVDGVREAFDGNHFRFHFRPENCRRSATVAELFVEYIKVHGLSISLPPALDLMNILLSDTCVRGNVCLVLWVIPGHDPFHALLTDRMPMEAYQ
jgi:hypothetical protein